MDRLPKRSDDLIEQDVAGELVVYDPVRGQAHYLNDSAALVFRNCDGTKSVAKVAEELPAGAPTEAREAAVRMAVDQLAQNGLVAHSAEREAGPRRRDFVKRWGQAAVAIPAVMSVMAALPASAQSACVVLGGTNCNGGNVASPCTNNAVADAQCATNFCGFIFVKNATSCLDDPPVGPTCLTPNGTDIQNSCASARAAAAPGNLYGCSVCP